MATRVLGPTGSKRRRRFLLVPMLCMAALALFWIGSAQAVHDVGIFQLEGTSNGGTADPWIFPASSTDASQPDYSSPPANVPPEDWDLICTKHLSTLLGGTCVNDTGYVLPFTGSLAAPVAIADNTINVTESTANGHDIPSVPFAIQIVNNCGSPPCAAEEMQVTARTPGTPATYQVTRGFNSTTAATHASGARVYIGTVSNPSAFVVDPSQSATDDILKGGTKDDNEITSWDWASAKPSPPKNDITDAYAAEYTCNTTACANQSKSGHKILYFGGDRLSNNGSANLAFWFFQHSVKQYADGTGSKAGQCVTSSGCPFTTDGKAPAADGSNLATHKAGDVSLSCGTFTGTNPGDLLVISAFGPKANIQVYEWVGVGNAGTCVTDNTGTHFVKGLNCFTNTCSLQPLLPVAGQPCTNVLTGDNVCATVNDTDSKLSPWHVPQKESGSVTTFEPTNFFEGGLDLTALRVEACFSSFLLNTRASSAGDAELHDKIVGQFARCAPNMTTQQSAGTNSVSPGTPVTDTATITISGALNPDDPAGTVKFFICKASELTPANTGFCTTGGTQVGTTAVTLNDTDCGETVPPGSPTDGKACAKSVSVNDSNQTGYPRGSLSPGRYCFRAEADLTNYDDPSPFSDNESECFTVRDTSSLTTAQNWLPNDSGTVTLGSGSGNLSGTLAFALYDSNNCTGTRLYPGATTLAADITTTTQTTITVASSANFPSVNNFRIQIGSEILRVTGGQGTTTWTVVRGVDGTTAAAHNSGDAVTGLSEDVTFSSLASPVTKNTSNTTFKITSADAPNGRDVSWKVVFTSSDSFVDSPANPKCELTHLVITN